MLLSLCLRCSCYERAAYKPTLISTLDHQCVCVHLLLSFITHTAAPTNKAARQQGLAQLPQLLQLSGSKARVATHYIDQHVQAKLQASLDAVHVLAHLWACVCMYTCLSEWDLVKLSMQVLHIHMCLPASLKTHAPPCTCMLPIQWHSVHHWIQLASVALAPTFRPLTLDSCPSSFALHSACRAAASFFAPPPARV